jgi:multicomponent Na+:H+ antiporter subunit B
VAALLMNTVLLAFLVVAALAVVRVRNLYAAAMLTGIFSLLSAALFTSMDAVDVAFTEASVGAGISTVLMLGALALTRTEEKPRTETPWMARVVVTLTAGALMYGTVDMPRYGDPNAPIHHHVAPRYIVDSPVEVGMPNMVTSVLASYRGYDTLGETTVVLTAAIGVLLLFAVRRRVAP